MKNLEITSCNILPIENGKGGCVAVASVILNNAIKLTGLKLIAANGEKYISYPRNFSNKHKKSFCYPITVEATNYVRDTLWEKYNEVTAAND
jgi:DNA-binding cell septation regulator SpoVG